MKKLFAAGLLFLALASRAAAGVTTLADETALAYDKTYTMDLTSLGIGAVSVQTLYSYATVPSKTFTDGTGSTGSFRVITPTSLGAAYAVNQLTVANNTGLSGATIVLPGAVLTEGVDWRTGVTATNTAVSIRGAMVAKAPWMAAVVRGAVIYATATAVGTQYNAMTLTSSLPAKLVVASPAFAGGQNAASIAVNGYILKADRDFATGGTASQVATYIATAINAHSKLKTLVTATPDSPTAGYVALASKFTGGSINYPIATSTQSALAVSGPAMTGGAASAYALSGSAITVPAHGFTRGLPVLYTQAAGVPIGGLTNQTTYFVIPVTADSIRLADSKAHAVAGTNYATFTSTHAPTNTYTLAPLAISGSPSFKWQVSNDNSTWVDLTDGGASIVSGTIASTSWSFGTLGYRYFRLNVTGPTTGGVYLNSAVNGADSSAFVARAGDNMSGPLTMVNTPINLSGPSGYVYSASSVTAGRFVGPLTGAVTGNVTGSVTGAASLNVLRTGDAMTGALGLARKTKAEIDAITPALGDQLLCTDCTVPYDLCVATAAALSGFRATLNSAINTAIPGTLVPKGCGTDE